MCKFKNLPKEYDSKNKLFSILNSTQGHDDSKYDILNDKKPQGPMGRAMNIFLANELSTFKLLSCIPRIVHQGASGLPNARPHDCTWPRKRLGRGLTKIYGLTNDKRDPTDKSHLPLQTDLVLPDNMLSTTVIASPAQCAHHITHWTMCTLTQCTLLRFIYSQYSMTASWEICRPHPC